MPKPNPNKRKEHQNRSEFNTSEKILLETKPSFWLYSDNFIRKNVEKKDVCVCYLMWIGIDFSCDRGL